METNKWKKYQSLVDFGIKDETDLEDITRYDADNYIECLHNIGSELGNTEYGVNLALLVPQKETQGLPQFLTRTNKELEEAYKHISQIDIARFKEIWHFRSKTNANRFWGRQCFVLNELFPRIVLSTVELLPRSSGRILNQYPNVPDGYVRMTKKDRPYPFKVVESIIKTSPGYRLIQETESINRALSLHQKRLLDFSSFCQGHGSRSITFDFHYFATDKQIKVLDWDTNNESKILEDC